MSTAITPGYLRLAFLHPIAYELNCKLYVYFCSNINLKFVFCMLPSLKSHNKKLRLNVCTGRCSKLSQKILTAAGRQLQQFLRYQLGEFV